MRLTLTNGTDAAEVYAYTVLHTSSVVVVTWTNEQSNVVTDTSTLWTPVSPPFNGLESAWACAATNLTLSNGTGVWEDANISSNARVRFYGVANQMSSDEDGLTDGAETFLYHTDSYNVDTDGDGLLDGYDIVVGFGDARYDSWAGLGIIYVENGGVRTFRGELSAGTDPLDDDSDNDGLLDGWEVQNELDPIDADGVNGPEGDLDEDGFVNGLEWELGAPANNAAWNGNELAYRLTHAHPATNARWGATNLIGMRVDIDISKDCGGTAGTQDKRDPLDVPALLECGYYINVKVEGSVEDVDIHYDEVTFEAFTNTFYFMGHSNRPTECRMVSDSATRNVLIMGNSTVNLRYNTVSYKWHNGAYCEITDATNTGPYNVVVSGDDAICVGETTTMGASGAAGPPFTWSGSGDISVSTNGDVTGLAPGLATVIAAGSNGCSGEKKIFVLKPDIGTASPLADRTLHPSAARQPLLLKQTLPAAWNGPMQLSLSSAIAYWSPTGGVPIPGGTVFTNSQLPQTVYLEGDGCGVGQASFSIVGPPGCGTNVSFYVISVDLSANTTKEFGKDDHYLKRKNSGDVIVTATISPSAALSAITWSGGSPGVDNLHRVVDSGTPGDYDVNVLLNGSVIKSIRIHIVDGNAAPAAIINAPKTCQLVGTANPGGNFGLTVVTIGQQGVLRPDYSVNPYFSNDQWVFRVNDISHGYKLGINSQGRIDLPVGTPTPFPLVSGMDITQSHTRARSDLDTTGLVVNGPPRVSYWVEYITQAHEQEHVNHFYSSPFWIYYMGLFESDDVEASSVYVIYDCSNGATVTGAGALNSKSATWDTAITDRHNAADAAEIGGSEVHCHGVSNPMYQPIWSAIPNP